MSGYWIGVDLDGTLAEGHASEIGPPVAAMLDRVRAWVGGGVEVRVVTARAGDQDEKRKVHQWLGRWGVPVSVVTDRKDFQMLELWDDRAVRVLQNTGLRCCDEAETLRARVAELEAEVERLDAANHDGRG